METALQRYELMLPGVKPREFQRSFNRFRPAVAEESFGQSWRRNLRDFLGEICRGLDVIQIGCAMNQLVHLRFGRGDHLRIAVARIDDRNSRKAIEIFPAVYIRDRRSAAPIDNDRGNGF